MTVPRTGDPVAAGVALICTALGGLVGYSIALDQEQEQEPLEVVQEAVEAAPLDGEFTCSYYKSTTLKLENITSYEVVGIENGWNWVFQGEDGSSFFYTQTAGQLCYVRSVVE